MANNENINNVIYLIWGQKANDDFTSGKLVKTDDDCDGHAKRYEFDTENELNAFKKGIEESQGWNDATVVKASEVEIRDNGIIENNSDFMQEEEETKEPTVKLTSVSYKNCFHVPESNVSELADNNLIHYDGTEWRYFDEEWELLSKAIQNL